MDTIQRYLMTINKKDVMHVARLARLEIDETMIETFANQLGKILDHVDTLNSVDTQGIKPTSHAIDLVNAFREDEPAAHLENEKALANAPAKEDGAFIVPKVVG